MINKSVSSHAADMTGKATVTTPKISHSVTKKEMKLTNELITNQYLCSVQAS